MTYADWRYIVLQESCFYCGSKCCLQLPRGIRILRSWCLIVIYRFPCDICFEFISLCYLLLMHVVLYDQVRIVHICEATLTKRLIEFEDTASGSLTVGFAICITLLSNSIWYLLGVIYTIWYWLYGNLSEIPQVGLIGAYRKNSQEGHYCSETIYVNLRSVTKNFTYNNLKLVIKEVITTKRFIFQQ